jgi:hypothetical protein
MGRLTDIIIDDTTKKLDFLFDKFKRLEGERDNIIEGLGFRLVHIEIERLGFYNQEKQVEYAIRFNEILMGRKDFLPHEVRDSIYAPEEDRDISFKILSGLMSEAILGVEKNPKSFEKKEMYLYLLQRLAPLNLAVSQGYAEVFNKQQITRAKKKGDKYYQIMDRGNGKYVLSCERK